MPIQQIIATELASNCQIEHSQYNSQWSCQHNLFYKKMYESITVGLLVASICQHLFHLCGIGSDCGCVGWSTIIYITDSSTCHSV